MITRQELEGHWKQIKGQIRERWGEFTDDELQQLRGETEQLVGAIQKRTGQSRREIEKFLENAIEQGHSVIDDGKEAVRQYAESVRQSAQDGYRHVAEHVEAGLEEAQETVRERPLESLLVAFGAGLVAGVVVSLLIPNQRG